MVLASQFGRPNLWWRHRSYVIISVSVCFSVPETLNLWWYERSQVRSLGTKVHAGRRWSSSGFQTEKIPKLESIVTIQEEFDCRTSGTRGWDQQHVSPEGGSSSWLPLCAEHLHGTIKKAAEGLWPRHEIHLGIQTLPGLHHIHTWVCCHFYTNPANTNIFSSGRSNFVNIDGDCISCLPISNKEFKSFNLLINHLGKKCIKICSLLNKCFISSCIICHIFYMQHGNAY